MKFNLTCTFLLTFFCSSLFAQTLEYPRASHCTKLREKNENYASGDTYKSWCDFSKKTPYVNCMCSWEKDLANYKTEVARIREQQDAITDQIMALQSDRRESANQASNIENEIDREGADFESMKSNAISYYQDAIGNGERELRLIAQRCELSNRTNENPSPCNPDRPLKQTIEGYQYSMEHLQNLQPQKTVSINLSSSSSSNYSNSNITENYSSEASTGDNSNTGNSSDQYSSSSTSQNSSHTNQESTYYIPTPEEIYASARAEEARQDAISDEFEQDFGNAINSDGSVNAGQAGYAVTKAITNSTGNAQTGAIAGAVTTGATLLIQGLAARKERKQEEARLEMERLNKVAREGIGTYDGNGERSGDWWFGYGHDDLKAKGAYVDGIQNGRWIYREQGENDLTLAWYDMGKRQTSLKVYWFNENGQSGYRDAAYKLWLTGNAYHLKKGNRHYKMMNGRYVDGQRQGEFNFFHDNGSHAQRANYVNNVLQGSIIGWRPTGNDSKDTRIFAGVMEDGVKQGEWYLFHGHADKLAAVGAFDKDNRIGIWKYASPNGAPTSSVTYDNDLKNGLTNTFYSDGSLKGSRMYIDDVPDGEWVDYYHLKEKDKKISDNSSNTGKKKKSVGHFALRVLVPHVLVADALGKKKDKSNEDATTTAEVSEEDLIVMTRTTFRNGLLDGKYERFYTNGEALESGTFAEGQPVGEWTYGYANGNVKEQGAYITGREVSEDFFFKVTSKDFADKWNSDFRNNDLAKGLPIQEDIYRYQYDTDRGISDLSEGIRVGTWNIYYENGELKEIINYDEKGNIHGAYESFYDNGNPKAIGEYYMGKKVGDWQNFKANGDEKSGLLSKKEDKKNEALSLFKKKKK